MNWERSELQKASRWRRALHPFITRRQPEKVGRLDGRVRTASRWFSAPDADRVEPICSRCPSALVRPEGQRGGRRVWRPVELEPIIREVMRPAFCLALVIAATGLGMARSARASRLGMWRTRRKNGARREGPARCTPTTTRARLSGLRLRQVRGSGLAVRGSRRSEAGDDKGKTGPVKDQAYWAKRRKSDRHALSRQGPRGCGAKPD
jgi:hypothetical protein